MWSSRPGHTVAPYGVEDPHELHDESSPGTGPRVIPGDGATRPTGSGWLRQRAALSRVGGALSSLPHLTFQQRAGHDQQALTATHQQPEQGARVRSGAKRSGHQRTPTTREEKSRQ